MKGVKRSMLLVHTHQPSCGTLAPLVEPHARYHGRQAGTPHSWYKERLLANLEQKRNVFNRNPGLMSQKCDINKVLLLA